MMALIGSPFQYLRCYVSLPHPTISNVREVDFGRRTEVSAASAFKLPCSKSSIFVRKSSVLGNSPQNVVIPSTPLIRTFDVLDAFEDEYGGAVVNPACLPDTSNAFAAVLQSSLSYWRQKGKRGVWLKILENQADLVPIAVKAGFNYHHAEPGYVMLTLWLPDEPCTLPSTSMHQIGVGGFVINENREVLVVKERKCPSRCLGIWKLPTGFIDKSEDIFSGAVREVKEETGIETCFLDVVAFRHAHQVTFDKSDLLFICMLKPLSLDISVDELEIEEAMWMPVDEFVDQPFHQEDRMCKTIIDICIARCQKSYKGFTAREMVSKLDNRIASLYCGELEESSR